MFLKDNYDVIYIRNKMIGNNAMIQYTLIKYQKKLERRLFLNDDFCNMSVKIKGLR